MAKISKVFKKILKIFGWIIAILAFVVLALLLFIRSPWGQDLVIQKVTAYVAEKTQATFSIDRLFFTFRGNIYIEGLYVEDVEGDTLIYSNNLETGINPVSLIRTGNIDVSRVEWEGLVARVDRDEDGKFNFDFLLDAFTSGEPASVAQTDSVSNAPSGGTSSPEISIGPVRLSDFNLIYKDRLMGLDTKFRLGILELDLGTLDLDEMQYHVEHFYFSDSELTYLQTNPFPPSEDTSTTETVMPIVIIEDFTIDQVVAKYQSPPDGIDAEVSLGRFFLNLPEADLKNQKILAKEVSLNDSELIYHSTFVPGNDTTRNEDLASNTAEPFSWPDWIVEVGQVQMGNNRVMLTSDGALPKKGVFNPSAIALNNLDVEIRNLFLKGESTGFDLDQLSFTEASGFILKDFSFDLTADNSLVNIQNLVVESGNSKLKGGLSLNYKSMTSFLENPENVSFRVNLPEARLGIRDAYYFSPELRENDYVSAFGQKNFQAELKAGGTMRRVSVEKFLVNWGDSTNLKIVGRLDHPTVMDKMFWDVSQLEFASTRKDVQLFVKEDSIGIRFPEKIQARMDSKGNLDSLVAKAKITAYGGEVDLSGFFKTTHPAFDIKLGVLNLPVGDIIQNSDIGTLSFDLRAVGEGETLDEMKAKLSANFEKLELYGYDYNSLELSGGMENGEGQVELLYNDENLDFNLDAQLALDSVDSHVQMNIDLKAADFLALGLSPRDIRAAFMLSLVWEGNMEAFTLGSELQSGTIVFEETPYPIGDFDLDMLINADSSGLNLESALLDVRLASNSSVAESLKGFNRHFEHYFEDSTTIDTVATPVELTLAMDIRSSALLNQVLLPGLEQLDPGKLDLNFSESSNELTASLDFPYISYSGVEIDSLGLRVRSDSADFGFAFGLANLETGPLSLARTYFTGEVQERKLFMDFNAQDQEETLVHVAFDLVLEGDTTSLHVDPENLILNKRIWGIPEENAIHYASQYLQFSAFELSRNNQYLTFGNDLQDTEEPNIGVVFRDFRLSTFTSILNPDELIAGGLVNGKLIIDNPFGATGIIADVKVEELKVLDVALGNLALNAQSQGTGNYDFNLFLKDGGIDLDLEGEYLADQAGANLNLALDLNKVEMNTIEGLSEGAISNADGYISGHFDVQGTTIEPKYEGSFTFNQAVFTIATLNSRFTLSEEEIELDNEGVYLDNFTLNDQDDNSFTIDGNILTKSFSNPSFDLKLIANNFRVLNSTREDNDLFYGNATIDADVDIKGDLKLPKITANLGVNSGTNLTFIIPESQLEVVEREGVVLFVNRKDPDDILTRREAELTASGFSGYEVAAVLKVAPGAIFNVVVDERSGDNLMVTGEANLNLNMDPNGRVTLTGAYEVQDGHYEMSLYNLVNRRFEFEEGSRMVWNGDPMDATLSLTAIYEVKTSASELMSATAAGGSRESMGKYRQELPFLVYLNIDGELVSPEISFRLDMPEEQQGAIGGNVYSQVQQLNTQAGELNRQVFSLLVLNRFFPDSGTEGGGGSTTAMAKSSVSQVLSGQLNSLSDNLLGDSGLELDMDLDSFTDYQGDSPQARTQLNVSAKKGFMDDRLVVQVGSQIDIEGSNQNMGGGNPLLGNVSIEYLLTENGRYRVRGFRKNSFESIIDGQLLITGLSIIFNRDFNRFYELWKGIETQRNGGLPENGDENTNPVQGKAIKESEEDE